MTKLDELIKELCPNGVEYIALSAILKIKNGRDYKQYGQGNIPVYGSGGIMAYIDTAVYEKPSVLIPRKGSLDKLYYVEKPFWTVDTIFYTEIDTKKVFPKYVFYVLQKEHLERLNKAGGVPSLTQNQLSILQIPLPPLVVQCEIVRILDDYTEQVKILQCKLQEELDARRKQYEYYRDKFLSFDKLNEGREVRWLKLKEIAMIKTGTKPVEIFSTGKYEYVNAGTGNSGYVDSYNMVGDVVTTPSRGQGGIGYVGYQSNAFWLGPLCYSIQSQDSTIASNKFLYYLLVQQRNDILAAKKEGGIPALNAKDLLAIKLPLPPLEVQEKIVETLDHFDALCNDLSEGLSAEIEARQKQYEYYRDKLLSFKECV